MRLERGGDGEHDDAREEAQRHERDDGEADGAFRDLFAAEKGEDQRRGDGGGAQDRAGGGRRKRSANAPCWADLGEGGCVECTEALAARREVEDEGRQASQPPFSSPRPDGPRRAASINQTDDDDLPP